MIFLPPKAIPNWIFLSIKSEIAHGGHPVPVRKQFRFDTTTGSGDMTEWSRERGLWGGRWIRGGKREHVLAGRLGEQHGNSGPRNGAKNRSPSPTVVYTTRNFLNETNFGAAPRRRSRRTSRSEAADEREFLFRHLPVAERGATEPRAMERGAAEMPMPARSFHRVWTKSSKNARVSGKRRQNVLKFDLPLMARLMKSFGQMSQNYPGIRPWSQLEKIHMRSV